MGLLIKLIRRLNAAPRFIERAQYRPYNNADGHMPIRPAFSGTDMNSRHVISSASAERLCKLSFDNFRECRRCHSLSFRHFFDSQITSVSAACAARERPRILPRAFSSLGGIGCP